jgi:hypothetical protein
MPWRIRKKTWLWSGIGLLVVLSGLCVILWQHSIGRVPALSQATLKAAQIKLYHPRRLQDNLQFDQATAKTVRDATITIFENSQGRIILTQQPKPKDIDLKQIDAAETFLTQIGTAYVLKGEPGKIQLIVDSATTWLLVSGDEDVGLPAVKHFINSLEATMPQS